MINALFVKIEWTPAKEKNERIEGPQENERKEDMVAAVRKVKVKDARKTDERFIFQCAESTKGTTGPEF
jgi:NADH:ubiquinone oxidoreductase subunit D